MIRKPSRSALAAISLLCVVLLAACSSGNPFITSVTITPTSATIDSSTATSGNTQQFTATALFSNGTQSDVTSITQWASSNSGAASIDATGLAKAGNPPDTTTVTITGTAGGHSATATLTVVHGIQSISVTPLTASISLTGTQQYKATATYKNAAGMTHTEDATSFATWTSSVPATATINGSGLATGVAAGTTNITATVGAVTSTPVAVLTDAGVATLTSIAVAPLTASIDALVIGSGDTQQFTAKGTYSDNSTKDITAQVTWSSSNSAIATINAAGLASAATPPDTATATITASLSGKSGTGALTVVHAIQSIAVAPLAQSIALGLTQQFTATGTYKNVAGATHTETVTSVATWASGTPATATINGSGLATSVAQGTTNITATIGAVTSTPVAVLTVTAPVAKSLQITPGTPNLALGTSATLIAAILNTDGSTTAIGPTDPAVTWAPSNCTPAGAVKVGDTAVNAYEAVGGIFVGSCTITATQGTLTGTGTVTVATGSTHFAYVANNGDSTIGGYSVTASSATPLTALTPPTTSASGSTIGQAVLNTNGKYLYSIDLAGAVHVYTVSSAGALALVTPEPSPLPSGVGKGIIYGLVDPTGRFFLVADNKGKAIHSAAISPTNGQLGTVSTATATGMTGPEFVALDRKGNFAFVVSDDGNLYSFSINQTDGTLTSLANYPVGTFPVAVTVDPSNSLVYVGNSGDNTISVFTLNATTGALTAVGTPFAVPGANFVSAVLVDPATKYLFVLDGSATGTVNGSVYAFNINATTGVIGTQIGTPAATQLSPFGMALDPTGTLIAVENNLGTDSTGNSPGSISLFKVTAGAVASETPPTVATGKGPLFVTFLNAP